MKYFLILSFLALTALTQPAWAEPSAADRTTARRLAVEGQLALQKGDFDTAADRFERANELVPAPSLLVRLARARVGQGRLVEAYEAYRTVIREGVESDAPRAFKRALEEAKEEVTRVEPRLAWVTVNVKGPDPNEVKVTFNGNEIPSAALGAQRPVDPGTLKVRAEAEGYEPAKTEVKLAEGQHLPAIELRLTALPEPEPALVEVQTGQQPIMTRDGGEPSAISQSTLAYIALGLGGAGLAIGSVSGIIAMDRHSEVEDLPCEPRADGACQIDGGGDVEARFLELKRDFDTFSTAANVGFIAGGVLAATGLILLVTAPGDEGAAAQATFQPYVGFGSIGAVGTF